MKSLTISVDDMDQTISSEPSLILNQFFQITRELRSLILAYYLIQCYGKQACTELSDNPISQGEKLPVSNTNAVTKGTICKTPALATKQPKLPEDGLCATILLFGDSKSLRGRALTYYVIKKLSSCVD